MDENNENKKIDLADICANYGGAIIGGLVALLLCFTGLYKLLVTIVVVIAGVFLGNYIQKNKTAVKEKIKDFIDKV
ncbi:MAG: DUF2273 domain-containing protein [Clostridia bacterium]|nr:DUF2273 domain-containing protein [Clostridia bacterium]